ncbi:MAG: hypothetical protein DWQ05_21090 [Calditrichaeota bacterium]|nr:MAG: hypothetical protein DWQ05_21090 [Calditrichota bacterium]
MVCLLKYKIRLKLTSCFSLPQRCFDSGSYFKGNRILLLALFLFCWPIDALIAQKSPITTNNFQVRYYHIFTDSSRVIFLPDSFIVAGTDSLIFNANLLQRGEDYRLEFRRNRLTFPKLTFQKGDSLLISYQRLLLPLKKNYSLLKPIKKPDSLLSSISSGAAIKRRAQSESAEYGSKLRKSGSLVRGLSLGSNQGLKVDSGLRLQVTGEVAEGVKIIAALTDQSTPIQPEGNTQTLQEIDKVFIQIKAKNFETTLGDYHLKFSGTEFTRYARKLQGVMATVYPGKNVHFTLSGAVSKGKFRSQEFQGIEGNQGPYQLTGDRGQIDILVLAGTERVWIDGIAMVRGENNDYVIEYGSGEITFTRKRLITADSRLVIDFQYSDERFQRSLYGMETGLKFFNEKLSLKTTILREKDDADNPLGTMLTEDSRNALSASGDGQATVNGATLVGAGEGSYILQDSVFVYVGINQGNYQVRFSDMGPSAGSYVYEGFGRYSFAGQGGGRYAPLIVLPQAQKHDVADMRLDYQAGAAVKISAELAVSDVDRNLYSSTDDGDNSGQAYLLSFLAAPERLSFRGFNLGAMSLRIKHRFRGRQYQDIDRANEIEFGRQWDLGNEISAGDELITETEFKYAPQPNIRFFTSAGMFDQKGSGVSSKKVTGGTQWQTPNLVELNYNIENIEKSKDAGEKSNSWLRQNGEVQRTFWFFKPMFSFENEIKKEIPLADTLRSGFQFTNLTAGLGFARFKHLAAQIKFSQREDDDRFAGMFQPHSTAKTRRFETATKNIKNFHFSGAYTHRTREYQTKDLQDTRTDLAEVKIGSTHWKKAVKLDGHYQITNTQVGKQERVYFKVEEGEGNFRYEESLDEYVSDPFGDYIVRLLPTDDFIPVVELKGQVNIRFKPKNALRSRKKTSLFQKIMSNIATETFLRVEEKTQESEVRDIFLLNLNRFQNPAVTLFGNMSIRQDISIFEKRRDLSLRYRLLSGKSINNQYLDDEQKRRHIRHEWRLNLSPSNAWAGRFEIIRTIEDKTFSKETRPDRFIRGFRFVSDISYRPKPRLELALRSVFGRDLDKAYTPATEVQQVTVKPRTSYSFRGRGRFRADVEYTKVSANDESRIIPYELAQGYRLGDSFRWNLTFEYRMANNLNTSVSYQGRDEPQREETIHVAKVEMRAYF